MASDVADMRALLLGLDLPLRFDAPDTVVGAGGETGALGFFVSTHAPGFVAVVNALPALLDRTERMEAELRDLGQQAEAAQCALVDERVAASEARHEAAMLQQELDEICGYAFQLLLEVAGKVPVREEIGAAEGETLLAAAKRVMRQHAALVRDVDALRAAAHAAGWRDALATGEHLVTWVRRGALREALAVARAEPGVPSGATQADFNAVECAGRIADGIAKLMGGE